MKDLVYGRELRLMEITAIGFRLFLDNIKTILKGVLVICLPISILLYLVQWRMMNVYDIMQAVMEAQNAVSPEEMLALSKQIGITNILALCIGVFLEPIFVIGVMKAMKRKLEGAATGGMRVYADAMLLEGNVVKTGIIYAVCVILGSMLVFPGIYLMVIWYFYLCCIALVGKKGGYALAHSRDMVKGRWWKTYGFMIFLSILGFGWNSILQVFFVPFPNSVVKDILYTCVTYLTEGYIICCMTVLFLNREAGLFGMEGLQEETPMETEEK